jgi:hypothetical protein
MKKIKPIKIPKGTTNSIPERTIETTNCIPERTIELPTVGNDKVWALKLAEKKPAQTDRELMGKLEDILDGKIEEIIRARYSEYGFESDESTYLIKSDDRDKLFEAYKLAQYSLQPLSFEDAKKQLRILYSVQARVGEGISVKEKAHQMALLLADVPADLLVHAIEINAKTQKFWTSYAELWQLVSFRIEKRKRLLESLESRLKTL